jgi:hypothetical protein
VFYIAEVGQPLLQPFDVQLIDSDHFSSALLRAPLYALINGVAASYESSSISKPIDGVTF